MFLQCFSAESIFEELDGEEEHDYEEEQKSIIEEHEEEHHEEPHGEHHEEPHGEHHEGEEEHDWVEEEKTLIQRDFEQACASIVLRLVQGYCIGEEYGPIVDIYTIITGKKSRYLSEEDFKKLLNLISLLNYHDDHDHRRRRSAGLKSLQQRGSGTPHSVHRREVDDHAHGQTNGASGSVSYDGE